MMTHKEIAGKILDAIDLREKSYVKTGTGVDRVGKIYEDGFHTKTRTQCFQELFGDDPYLLYEPYRQMFWAGSKDIESWAISVLKNT